MITKMTNEESIVSLLEERKWHISFAESCTAGLAAARLVNVPNVSGVFDASYVTYANEAKIKSVGVSAETLRAHGAVSEEVAGEMALGCAKASGAEVGVGISGIAGPGGGTAEKPVGTVCFGFYTPKGLTTVTKHFGSLGRAEVRRCAVDYVFEALGALLK
jgi:nicotinamide-nucleotide amidase